MPERKAIWNLGITTTARWDGDGRSWHFWTTETELEVYALDASGGRMAAPNNWAVENVMS